MDKIEVNIEGKEIKDLNKSLAIHLYENLDKDVLTNVQNWLGETHLLIADSYDYVTNQWTNIRSVDELEIE